MLGRTDYARRCHCFEMLARQASRQTDLMRAATMRRDSGRRATPRAFAKRVASRYRQMKTSSSPEVVVIWVGRLAGLDNRNA